MTVTIQQEQEICRLLAGGASERKIVDAVGTTRRQVRNIKQKMEKEEDQNPLTSDLRPTMKRQAAVTEVVKLSTRPEGVRRSEMGAILRARYGMRINEETGNPELNMSEDQFRYLRDRTKKAAAAHGKEALFIPEWLPRQAPVAANDMLISMAGHLYDRLHEYVSEFMTYFPEASRQYVFKELTRLSIPETSQEPVQTRCQRNAATAEALQRRLGTHAGQPPANEPFPFAPDAELDRLCI